MLAVKGYQRNELMFSNTTALRFNLRNVSTVIQTDRSRYQPEETVRVRIVCVQSDYHPYKGMVDITIQVRLSLLCERAKPEDLNRFLEELCTDGQFL